MAFLLMCIGVQILVTAIGDLVAKWHVAQEPRSLFGLVERSIALKARGVSSGAAGIELEFALDGRARANRLDASRPRRKHAESRRAQRRASASAPEARSIVRPVTSAIICAQKSDRAPPPTSKGRVGRAPAASSTSTPSANEKATPSMTAKTSASALCPARRPANIPVASASLSGVRSPLR